MEAGGPLDGKTLALVEGSAGMKTNGALFRWRFCPAACSVPNGSVFAGDKIAAIQGKGNVATVAWRQRPWLGVALSVTPVLISLVTR